MSEPIKFVILPGLLAQAKSIFLAQTTRQVTTHDGKTQTAFVTPSEAAKLAYLRWLGSITGESDLRALGVELYHKDDHGESDLTLEWQGYIGREGLHAINWLAAQLNADPQLRLLIAEREVD